MKCPKCGFENLEIDTTCKRCGESIYNIKNNITNKETIEALEINNNTQTNISKTISTQNKNNNSNKSNTIMWFIISVIVVAIISYQISRMTSIPYLEEKYGSGAFAVGFLYFPIAFFLTGIDMLIVTFWISRGLWQIMPIINKIFKKITTSTINYYKKSNPKKKKILLTTVIIIVLVIIISCIMFGLFLMKKHNIKYEDIIDFAISFIINIIKQFCPFLTLLF